MRKYYLIAFVFLTALLTAGIGYCQHPTFVTNDQQIKTVAGTVTYVDVAGSVIGVETKWGTMVLHISVESDLLRYSHHMASIEISKGDSIIVQYAVSPSKKNIIVKLVDKQPDTF